MAIETTRENVCVNHIVAQKTETVMVEGDSIIPDIKPDIINAISTSGIVCIYKKEINEGKVRLDGSVDTYVMYLADSDENSVRSINVNLDFTQVIDIPNAMPDMDLETNAKLKNIECKVINGRKVSIKAFIEISVKVTSREDIDIISSVNSKGMQTLNKSIDINSVVGRGSTKVYAKDTLMIDNIDNLSEIMKADFAITNRDIKISYNKVLAKSDLNVKIMYLTDDNRINSVESTIPVMGFIDIENVTEENICNTQYEIKNVVIKPNNAEEHSIYVEAEIEIYCEIFKNQEINVIQDLYNPNTNVIFTQKQIQVMQKVETMQSTYSVREKQVIPEIGGNKIYDVETGVELAKQTCLNDKILFEGEVKLNYLFDGGNGIDTKQTSIPFNFSADFMGVNQNSSVETNMEISMQDFVVTGDGSIEVKIDVLFNISLSKSTEINVIDDIKEEENRNINSCSLVIYYVKEGDTLWKIAKRFGSTVEEIARINGIENEDKLNIAQQLFIPRYNG